MKLFFAITAIVISSTCYTQVLPPVGADSSIEKGIDTNFVIIHKDPRIDLLIKQQAAINEITSREGRRTDKGFRLMIISTSNRGEAFAAKTKVLTYFPELKAYLWHQSPYYKVKAGDFIDREDAEIYQRRLNNYFPKGVFIMKDIIEVKKAKKLKGDMGEDDL